MQIKMPNEQEISLPPRKQMIGCLFWDFSSNKWQNLDFKKSNQTPTSINKMPNDQEKC